MLSTTGTRNQQEQVKKLLALIGPKGPWAGMGLEWNLGGYGRQKGDKYFPPVSCHCLPLDQNPEDKGA